MGTDEEPMKTLGSKGLIKEPELIRIITKTLYTLGFKEIGNLLEEQSKIPLHSTDVKLFFQQVKNGDWDESIVTLKGIGLKNEMAVKFLLLELKFFGFLKLKKDTEALELLRKEMEPLGVNTRRVHELASKVKSDSGKDIEFVDLGSNFVEKMQNIFPSELIVPDNRLEDLIERALDYHMVYCNCDYDLSLFSDHYCGMYIGPSETLQTLEKHTDEVWFLKFSNDGKYLASSSKDKSAIIWEINAKGKCTEKHKLVGHEMPVAMVLWSPDDKQVITCGQNEVIKRWDVDSGEYVGTYGDNSVGSVSCGWFHDGLGIIGGMTDRRICFWELDGTELDHKKDQWEPELYDVAITTDVKLLLKLGRLCVIQNLLSETVTVKLIIEEDMITSFSVSKNNKLLLTNLSTQKIHLWNIEDEPL